MFSQYLEASISNRDIKGIRGALKGIIDGDPAFKTGRYDSAVQYIIENGISESEIYEPNDTKYAQLPPSEWSKDYYYKVLTYLSYNFSRARIEHLRAVGSSKMAGDAVYGGSQKKTPVSAPDTAHSRGAETPKKAERQQTNGMKYVVIGIVVLALAVLLIVMIGKR